ncbi:MAG: hypothetical protein HOK97_24110 [Deltaproteobacteria bacterium]|nr:hypothetical protein [Deltaproteobacteria bacterium]
MIYLNDVENGGETVFPNIPVMSKARAGDALIWRSLDLRNRSCTNATLHSAGIVRVGEKFAYQRWFHLHPKRYDDFVEKFSNLRRLANIKADSTVVCESVVGSCRNYITVIPPDSDFFEDLETERRMLDRRSETSSQKWIEIRRVVTTIRFLERQVKMSCDRSVMLVHDANRLLQKNVHVVRALRRHAEIVFVESAGLGAVAFLAASFGTYTTFHVSSCERAQYIRDVWSDLNVSSFLRKRMRVTCGNDIVVKSSEASQVLIEFETCTPIIPQRYILKQGNILVSYRNLTSSLLPSSSFSNVVTSYVSDTYRPLLYSGTTTALDDDDDDDLRATCEVSSSSSSSSSRDDEGHRRVFIYY